MTNLDCKKQKELIDKITKAIKYQFAERDRMEDPAKCPNIEKALSYLIANAKAFALFAVLKAVNGDSIYLDMMAGEIH